MYEKDQMIYIATDEGDVICRRVSSVFGGQVHVHGEPQDGVNYISVDLERAGFSSEMVKRFAVFQLRRKIEEITHKIRDLQWGELQNPCVRK